MLSLYKSTPLEQWIETLYRHFEILTPEQLNIEYIADRLDIWVYFREMESRHLDRGGLFSINIDKRLSPQEQWEDFLHELCHVLRHTGNQFKMPGPLVEWQEQHAANFQLYAAIPSFMLKGMKLPILQVEIVDLLATEFHVTYELAERRLLQIQRRVIQGILDEEYVNSLKSATTYKPYTEKTIQLIKQLRQNRNG
jgi:hypothetical protein